MKELYIIGAGDTGRELIDLAERVNYAGEDWRIVGFIDENKDLHGTIIDGIPVLGGIEYLNALKKESFAICAIGNGMIKKKVIGSINNPNIRYATLIDPNVTLCKGSTCEEGSYIYANCALAINVKVGKHVYISFNCSIGHDTVLCDYVSAFPGVNVSGKVVVGESTVLGTGTKIIQGMSVSPNVMTGAGAVVVNDITEPGTYVGVPAKRLK